MKVALAQINATVGDLAGNARLVAHGRAPGPCTGRAWWWRPNWR
jgi:hypothetical protein